MSTPVQPTQVREPGRATARTVVQATIGVLLAIGIVVPAALAIIGDEFARWTSPEFVAVLGTASAVCVAVSAATARIMAIPQVNAWLANVGLSAGSGTVLEQSPWARPLDDGPDSRLGPGWDNGGADGIPDDNPQRAID